ncbi:MAG: S1C family serine protease [Patescibacteria group bacterium]|nr:S1C family serine protease [Patescibacteria group bacterium]MDD5121097.1 S1C family serine protease [Patescibacteria group bacterium]MDD5221931.1 S1C family serine protease [Patescibacteria group bacterium]MDD5395984.1 S1C family serine protease [Patescibacteria group bacterium]
MAQGSRVTVTDNQERPTTVKIKENERSMAQDQERKQSAEKIEQIYSAQNDNFYRPGRTRSLWLIIILAIIFGALAGLGGGIYILANGKIKIPFGQEINLSKYLPANQVNLTTEKKITVTQDSRVDELAKDFNAQLVNIFATKTTDSNSILDQSYYNQGAAGRGFALTSDGWLVFGKQIFNDWQKKYSVINGQSIAPAEKIIFDQANGVVFVKSSLKDLTAMKMTAQQDITPGQEVIIFAPDNSLIINSISNPNWHIVKQPTDLIHSTDQFSNYILLSSPVDQKYVGAPVVSLDRSIIGIVADKNSIKPCWQFNASVNQVLNNKKITHPFLGINYLSLAEINTTLPEYKNLNQNALVWGTPIKDSPANKAAIKDKDLIVKADGMPINQYYNLTDIVQGHKPGDTIELVIARQGVEKTLKIILGEK